MGFTPQQVDGMSRWQFQAALNGFIEANSPKGAEKLTETEAADLFDWIDAPESRTSLSTPTYAYDETGHLAPAGVVRFTLH